ncbi:MAG: hypothetical protein HFF10_09905 [Angelakisella sp.]|nr:hypothetical protein [Angelakisella sp.]
MDEIILRDTPDRFRPLAGEIVPPLLALLRERRALEETAWDRLDRLQREFTAAGGPPGQPAPGRIQAGEEYRRHYLELAVPRCVPGFLKRGAPDGCQRPAKYHFLDEEPAPQITFTMEAAQKAVVVISAPRGSLRLLYRFTLRPGPEGWLIARIDYHHSNETTWHIDRYL